MVSRKNNILYNIFYWYLCILAPTLKWKRWRKRAEVFVNKVKAQSRDLLQRQLYAHPKFTISDVRDSDRDISPIPLWTPSCRSSSVNKLTNWYFKYCIIKKNTNRIRKLVLSGRCGLLNGSWGIEENQYSYGANASEENWFSCIIWGWWVIGGGKEGIWLAIPHTFVSHGLTARPYISGVNWLILSPQPSDNNILIQLDCSPNGVVWDNFWASCFLQVNLKFNIVHIKFTISWKTQLKQNLPQILTSDEKSTSIYFL